MEIGRAILSEIITIAASREYLRPNLRLDKNPPMSKTSAESDEHRPCLEALTAILDASTETERLTLLADAVVQFGRPFLQTLQLAEEMTGSAPPFPELTKAAEGNAFP